jgi:Rrf2 family protein
MQIKRETDYAIRCILYLATQKDKVTMIDEIAKQMCVPRNFLAKIVQRLVKQDIIKSFRGIKGGLQLNRETGEISLLDVIEAVEGSVTMNDCAVDRRRCDRSNGCPVHPVWVDIREEVRKILKSKTFDLLVG